jgi:hypothetical protein
VVAASASTLIVSNIIAVKQVELFGLTLPAAVILFPVVYILGDVLTEVYGYARARQAIWIGFGCNLLAVAGQSDYEALRTPLTTYLVIQQAGGRGGRGFRSRHRLPAHPPVDPAASQRGAWLGRPQPARTVRS